MFTSRFSFRSFICLLASVWSAAADAQVVVTSYVQTGSLPANDDHHSGLYNSAGENLGFSVNFGGQTYDKTFVSNNGYITFGSGSGTYIPSAMDANYVSNAMPGFPIIAAFFSDVETDGFQQSGIVSWGTGLVGSNAAFVVKWDSVGEFNAPTFSPNTFSLVLISRNEIAAGDFDIYFNYKEITWDHGGAVAGYHNGSTSSPLFYQLPGSMTAGAFLDDGPNALTGFTNNSSAGDFLLSARNGAFLTPAAVVAIPEPSTYALLALGGGLLWLTARRRRA